MTRPALAALKPRKTPQQSRSVVTVDAICTATIQVLLSEGASRLTTTRVAERAGVSVGTMYQYFPNKQVLLVTLLEKHVEGLIAEMEQAAIGLRGRKLGEIADGLAQTWLDLKIADIELSRALYAVSAEFDIAEIVTDGSARLEREIATTLRQASDADFADPERTAFMLVAVLGGAVRSVLEAPTDDAVANLRAELPVVCRAYLEQVSTAFTPA